MLQTSLLSTSKSFCDPKTRMFSYITFLHLTKQSILSLSYVFLILYSNSTYSPKCFFSPDEAHTWHFITQHVLGTLSRRTVGGQAWLPLDFFYFLSCPTASSWCLLTYQDLKLGSQDLVRGRLSLFTGSLSGWCSCQLLCSCWLL